jgi:hypothetical protein
VSLFRQSLRPPSPVSEDAVARYVASMRAQLEPDPLFQRRLRGQIVNRYVAIREGVEAAPARGREMGRLGRAVLYASFTLAVSVTGVMAASQEALPGDPLYPLKRQVERLRHDVLPAHLEDDLVAIELTERLDELDHLTREGRTAAAALVVEEIHDDFAAIARLDPGAEDVLASRIVVLDALIERLPEPAQDAVEAVIADIAAQADGAGNPGGDNNDGSNPNGTTNAGGANNDGSPGSAPPGAGEGDGDGEAGSEGEAASDPTSAPSKSPRPDPTPRPSKSPKPTD